MNRLLPLALLLLVPAQPWAQNLVLWKVTNVTSPTIVPSYEGEDSPFPHTAQITEDTSGTIDPMVEAARLARLAALERAERILASREAFRPELGILRVEGRVENAAGEAKVLVANQWVGKGRKLNVRLTVASEASAAIADLRKYDADSANSLESSLMLRLQQRPFVELTITAITPGAVEMTSEYGTHRVPIPRAE